MQNVINSKINMNKENLELSPLKIEDIDEAIDELATVNEFEPITAEDIPEDLLEAILGGVNA